MTICEISLYIIQNEPDQYGQIFITPKAGLTSDLLELLVNSGFTDIPDMDNNSDGYYHSFKHSQDLINVAQKITALVKKQGLPNQVRVFLPDGLQHIQLQC
jgi:hypothetical protein